MLTAIMDLDFNTDWQKKQFQYLTDTANSMLEKISEIKAVIKQ